MPGASGILAWLPLDCLLPVLIGVFGFERVPERVRCLEDDIAEAEAICSAYESIAMIQDIGTIWHFM